MMTGKFNMYEKNIQKASIPEKLVFANKGQLCGKSYGLGFMPRFLLPLLQKLIARLKNLE